jgi:hypothetical protein
MGLHSFKAFYEAAPDVRDQPRRLALNASGFTSAHAATYKGLAVK